MTPDDFRALALALPEAVEQAHQGRPDFRIRGKIFATLGYPDETMGTVKLTPDQQEILCAAEPAMFVPVKGGWGRKGSTNVRLAAVDAASLRSALTMAWRNAAPKALLRDG
jgi:hypothetical protein